jgi:hypothetical protein
MVEGWRNLPRSQMFEQVIRAVGCAKGEAEAGEPTVDENFVRLCDEELFSVLRGRVRTGSGRRRGRSRIIRSLGALRTPRWAPLSLWTGGDPKTAYYV